MQQAQALAPVATVGTVATFAPDATLAGMLLAQFPLDRQPLVVAEKAKSVLAQKAVVDMGTQELILFGSPAQQAMGKSYDGILATLTLDKAPLTAAIFDQLDRGVRDLKLDEIKEAIKKAREPGWFGKMANFFGDTIRERLLKVQKTFDDLAKKIEADTQKNMQDLTVSLSQVDTMKKAQKASIADFAAFVVSGSLLLQAAEARVAAMRAEAGTDPLRVMEVEEAEGKVDSFRQRLVVLVGEYTAAPLNIKDADQIQVSIVQEMQTTANAFLRDLNDIKRLLIQLIALEKLSNAQEANKKRGEIRTQLASLNRGLVEQTYLDALAAPGDMAESDALLVEATAVALERLAEKGRTVKATSDGKLRASLKQYEEVRNRKLPEIVR